MADDLNLRRTYADICRGYSTELWRDRTLYIKHLVHYDQVDIDVYYEEALMAAKARGFKTRDERLKWLSDRKLWVRKDDSDLAMQSAYVQNLEKTKGKMFLKSQIDQIGVTLAEAQEKLWADTVRRDNLIGLTSERVAEQRVQFHYIYMACYQDPDLKRRAFTLDQIKELDDEESDSLISFYIKTIRRMDTDIVRKLALAPYFTNHFYLCGDNLHTFFARPIAELSNYQVNLLSYGSYYKNLLSANKVPDELRSDPDKLEEYINKTKNFERVVNNVAGDTGRVGIVGATTEDFKALGIADGTKTMNEAAERGYTNATDAAREMGVNWV